MMITISLDEIQRDLLGYLQRVQAGETFVILQADKPVAEIKQVRLSAKQFRPFGLCAGEFRTPDDFDAPLPEEIIGQFEGK
ncbi:type II toxin-antitoxin system Phd/YefM family antitoxin [Microseira sp. BLCC-F43]|jgi:antitoxin (DNA-binding transcriptional repressor) of toxin-antitoxin stability system